MTTVYISRHSIPNKDYIGEEKYKSLKRNKMIPLSVSGEKKAQKLSELKILQNIDIVFSSEYIRAVSTAKYIASKNNIHLNIDPRLGERIHGNVLETTDIDDYHYKQYTDKLYKLENGENQQEVRNRMLECLYEIINNDEDKNVFICSHQISMTFMLMNWCKLDLIKNELIYNDKIFDMDFNTPELFKLVFDNNKQLLSIENIKID